MDSQQISEIKNLIENSDAILVGAGAGLTASGGINYVDPKEFEVLFPEFKKLGYNTTWDCISHFWTVNDKNEQEYYGYWATHIKRIRYDAPVLQPYIDLKKILSSKDYFIFTSNVEHQFYKAGFPDSKILATQGNYMYFQCSKPCTQEIYDNYQYVKKIVDNIETPSMKARKCDIPHCPHCGRRLIPNLRSDGRFVEGPHMKNLGKLNQFIHDHIHQNVLLLELGVGHNSPGLIRYPFDKMIYTTPNWRMVRINLSDPDTPPEIMDRTIVVERDISQVLHEILE